jgi:hypothetical protein
MTARGCFTHHGKARIFIRSDGIQLIENEGKFHFELSLYGVSSLPDVKNRSEKSTGRGQTLLQPLSFKSHRLLGRHRRVVRVVLTGINSILHLSRSRIGLARNSGKIGFRME